MRRVADRVAGWLVARRGILAVAGVALAAVGVDRSRHLEFSRSIEAMFDRSDPALVPYARMTRTFGGSEVVLAAYGDRALFTAAGIGRLRTLAAELAALPGVASTTSLANTPLGAGIVDLDSPATGAWAARLVSLMEGFVVGFDRRTAVVACTLDPPAAPPGTRRGRAVSRSGTIDALRARMATLPHGTVAGEPAMLRDGFAMLERDGNLLGTAAGLLAGAVLLVSFRSLRWLVVPLAVVIVALWATRGMLAIAGLQLTMVSTMLSAMVTVVGIGTVTHVIVEFRRQRLLGLTPPDALRESIATLFWPVVGAIATDVVGFGSLVASDVGPVHDFGIMTAVGAAMVLVAAALAVPFLALAGRFDTDPRMAWGEGALERSLDRLVRRIVRHPLPILAGSALTAAAAIAGMRWLEVETDFTRNFRASSPTVAAYEFVESRLGGAGVWDVLVPAREPLDPAQVAALARLADRLRTEAAVTGVDGRSAAGLTKVLCLADVLEAAPPLGTLGALLGAERRQAATLEVLRGILPQLVGTLVGSDPADGSTWLRVMLRARERQPAAAKEALIAQVRRIAAEEFPSGPGRPGAEVTGFFVLLSQLVHRLLADQWLTFLIAAAGIFLLLAAAFRSPLVAAIALVPNGLPIFVVLGLLGWAGIRVNMGTAMIAAVSMGLSVDSSIHYIAAFRRRLAAGHALDAALGTAHQTAGRAMVFATLALCVGFLALTTSGFMPTVSFGWLSCLTMAGGLLGNLVVLPVLLAVSAPWIAPACRTSTEPLQR